MQPDKPSAAVIYVIHTEVNKVEGIVELAKELTKEKLEFESGILQVVVMKNQSGRNDEVHILVLLRDYRYLADFTGKETVKKLFSSGVKIETRFLNIESILNL